MISDVQEKEGNAWKKDFFPGNCDCDLDCNGNCQKAQEHPYLDKYPPFTPNK